MSFSEFDEKVKLLSNSVGELKYGLEEGSKSDGNAARYSKLATNLKELITSFELMMGKGATVEHTDEGEDVPSQLASQMKEALGDIKVNFKVIEDRYVELAKLAGDTEGVKKEEINR
jgi:hypothetical protein